MANISHPLDAALGTIGPGAIAGSVRPAIRIGLLTCLGFGVGTVGVSVMLNAVTAYFPAFMTTVLGQSPEIAGLLLMVSKLYDAVCDVVVGLASDRTRSRWGRRRPYLLAGAVVSSLSFLMIFAPAHLSDRALILYMAAALVLYSTGYSLFNVPYMTMPSEMTDGYHERTRLLSFRTLFVSLGQLLAVAGTSALIVGGGGGLHGYRIMALVMGLVILTTMAASFLGTGKARNLHAAAAGPRFSWRGIAGVFTNRPFVLLIGAKVFQFLGFASIGTTGLLFMLNVLHVGYTGQIELAVSQNVSMALAMPLWVRLGRRIGKRNTYLVGVGLFCLTALSWLAADGTISVAGLLVRGVVSGVGSGSIILMSVSMLSDTMTYDRSLAGTHREGVMSSVVAVIEKTSYALGVAVMGALLKVMQYVPTHGGALVTQPVSAMRALYAGYALIPVAMFLANGLFLVFYDLDESRLDRARGNLILAELKTMSATPRHEIPGDSAELARLSEMVVALLGELAIVTERLDTVERLLDRAALVQRTDIEAFEPDEAAQAERNARRARQIGKVFRPLRDEAERVASAVQQKGAGDMP